MNQRAEHLPWVSGPEATLPQPQFDARDFMRRARRRAFLWDAIDVALLIAVDFFVLTWEEARFPLFTRGESLAILLLVNVALIGSCWLRRAVSRWRAQRVATTWSASERSRTRL